MQPSASAKALLNGLNRDAPSSILAQRRCLEEVKKAGDRVRAGQPRNGRAGGGRDGLMEGRSRMYALVASCPSKLWAVVVVW